MEKVKQKHGVLKHTVLFCYRFLKYPKNLPKWEARKVLRSFFKSDRVPKTFSIHKNAKKDLCTSDSTVDAVRSAEGEFPQQSGGLLGKEGETCKRGLPLNALPTLKTFSFWTIFWVA